MTSTGVAATSNPASHIIHQARGVDAGALFVAAHELLRTHGRPAAPRGKATMELGLTALSLVNPEYRAAAIFERHLNPFLVLGEILWILSGRDDVAFLSQFSGAAAKFAPSFSLSAPDAYGPRLRATSGADQLEFVIDLLRRDSDSRRAIISFWDVRADARTDAFAVPCNLSLDFKVRDNALAVTVHNRANDLNVGFLYNLAHFSVLGSIVASALGLHFRTQTHVTTSLHVYTDDQVSVRMASVAPLAVPLYSLVSPAHVGFISRTEALRATNQLDGKATSAGSIVRSESSEPDFLSVAIQLLHVGRQLRASRRDSNFDELVAVLSDTPRCDWWILAAEYLVYRLRRFDSDPAQLAAEKVISLAGNLGPSAASFVAGIRPLGQ